MSCPLIIDKESETMCFVNSNGEICVCENGKCNVSGGDLRINSRKWNCPARSDAPINRDEMPYFQTAFSVRIPYEANMPPLSH